MIQVQLNLPKLTNKGKSNKRYLNQLEVETCKKFGGLTTYSGNGKWFNNGKLYYDKLNIYQIAIEPSKKKLFIKLSKKYLPKVLSVISLQSDLIFLSNDVKDRGSFLSTSS